MRVHQAMLRVDVFAEMVLAPERLDESLRQLVRLAGPIGLLGRLSRGAEQPRQLAEGMDRVALGDAVAPFPWRRFDVESRAADQPAVLAEGQQEPGGRFHRAEPLL